MLIRICHSNGWNILDSKEKLKDSSQLHKIKHWIPDTTASISSSKDPLTDAECAIPRLRLCHTQAETVEHIISGCQTLAADMYLNRHNQVAAQLHLDICKHYAIKVDAWHWYQHNPEWVMENEKTTVLWDHQVKTDRHIPCNKLDIIIHEKDSERCLIIGCGYPKWL